VAAYATACGSSGGSKGASSQANLAELRSQYTAPSGTLGSADIASVAQALSQEQAQTARIPVVPTSAPLHATAVGSLSLENSPMVSCTGGQGSETCTCPGGGSFSESGFSSSNNVALATVNYNACVFGETGNTTESTSGSISFADYQTQPPMVIYSGTLDETVTPPGTTTQINMNYALVNGVVTYNVEISSGNVLVSESGSWDSSTESGSFTVTDKSGKWSCSVTNGAGSCTGANGKVIQNGDAGSAPYAQDGGAVEIDAGQDSQAQPDSATSVGALPDGGACNPLPAGAPIMTQMGSGSAPASTGGTIVSGTYHVTASTVYGSCTPGQVPLAETLSITATTSTSGSLEAAVWGSPDGGALELVASESGTYTTSGSSLLVMQSCPQQTTPSGTSGYTATSTELVIVDTDSTNSCTTVSVWTKQ
jgi:hypothetical protein